MDSVKVTDWILSRLDWSCTIYERFEVEKKILNAGLDRIRGFKSWVWVCSLDPIKKKSDLSLCDLSEIVIRKT